MITAGAEKINNTNEDLMINDDICAMWRGAKGGVRGKSHKKKMLGFAQISSTFLPYYHIQIELVIGIQCAFRTWLRIKQSIHS